MGKAQINRGLRASGLRPRPAAPTKVDDAQIVDYLIAEARDAAQRSAALLMLGERVMATTVALVAIVSTAAVVSDHSYILMALPFAISVVIVYNLFLNNESMALAAYRAGLEVEIERRVGVPILSWETGYGKAHHNRVQVAAVVVLVGMAGVASAWAAIVQALHTKVPLTWGNEYSGWLIVGTVGSVVLGCALVLASFVAQDRTHKRIAASTAQQLYAAGN